MDVPPGTATDRQDAGALRHLVDALVDQLAAGQVETLYGLHSAAAGVRQQVEVLRAAAAAPAEALSAAAAGVQDAQAELVTARETLAEARAALQALVDTLRAELAAEVTAQVVAQVQTQVSGLVDAQVDAVVARVAAATDSLGAASQQWQQTVEAAATASAASSELWQRTVEGATAAATAAAEDQTRALVRELSNAGERLDAAARRSLELVEQGAAKAGEELQQATGAAVERLASGAESVVRASTETAAAIDEAGRILVDAFAGRVASFFSQLQQDLTKREARDTTRERALYERVQKLAEQGEARVKDLTDRLAHETAQLLSRDQELERQRAEAFVGVLETLLTRVGGRRQLRGRVRELVHAERDVPPPPPVPVPPAAQPAEPPQPAQVKRTAKRAAPVRTPAATKAAPVKATTKKTGTKKVTATKAPATKAAARRKDDA